LRKATLLLSLFFFISLVVGQPTSQPSKYYGTVQYDDGSDIGEVVVKAVYSVDGSNEFESTRTSDGNYELVVEEEQGENITQVNFYINDTDTGESANFSAFDSQQVNLSIPRPEPSGTGDGGDDDSGGGGGGSGGGFGGLATTDSGNTEPVAGFTWDTPVRPGEEVTLYASGSFDPDGNISEYRWSIGDTGVTAETVFGSPGSYPVTLTVEDDEGATTNVTKDVVVTENEAPVPSFEIIYTGSNILEDVQFNASESYDPDGNITQYTWSFDEQGVTASESFQESVNVTLTVVDNEGESSSVTKQLNQRVETGGGDGPEQSITGAFTSSETAVVGVLALALLGVGAYIVREKDLSVQVLRSDES
jgi:hypothetical protein